MSEIEIKFVVIEAGDGAPALGLLLEGLSEPPSDPRYSVLPADEARAVELGPTPEELLAPCSVTTEDRGVVLGVGDHVGERRLKPGQTVIIDVPGLRLRTIAEWPGSPARAMPAAAAAASAAHEADDADAVAETLPTGIHSAPVARVLADTLRRLEQADDDPEPDVPTDTLVSRLRPPASTVKLEEAQQRLSSIVSRIMSYEPPPEPVEPVKAAPAVPPPIASAFRAADGKMSAAQIAAAIAAAAQAQAEAAEMKAAAEAEVDTKTAGAEATREHPGNVDELQTGFTSAASNGAHDESSSGGDVPEHAALDGDHPPERRDYPIAPYQPAEVPVDIVGRRMSMAAMILAACAATVAVIGIVWMSVQTRSPQLIASAERAGAVRLAGGSAEGGPGSASAGGSLSDVFAIGPSSPMGRSRKDISLEAGLSLADQSLSKGVEGDRAEGEYWLRHALSIALGDERIRWALTQLGSGYAGGNGEKPDYAKARLLWEVAGQLGDPIALCFLGTLYEHGLGVPSDRPQALAWYSRAKQVGGCPGIDASIARVR